MSDWLPRKTSLFVWPLRSWRIRDDAAQDKGLGRQITKKRRASLGGGGGVGEFGNWAQSPAQHATLQASSSPTSKSPEISPEPLRQIIVINNKSPPSRPEIPLPRRLNPDQPAQPLTVCFQLCLFVCLLKDTRDCGSGEGYLHRAHKLKGVGKNKASNYMWFSPSWGIMGMVYLIGRDKLWVGSNDWPAYGKAGCALFTRVLKKKSHNFTKHAWNILFSRSLVSGGPPSCLSEVRGHVRYTRSQPKLLAGICQELCLEIIKDSHPHLQFVPKSLLSRVQTEMHAVLLL